MELSQRSGGYGVQPVWDIGRCTGGSNGSLQVPGKNPGSIQKRLAVDFSWHQ